MQEFQQNNKYYFTGPQTLIENMVANILFMDDKTYLGNFIQYKEVYLWGDILYDGKAQFEFGVISKGYYDKIIVL